MRPPHIIIPGVTKCCGPSPHCVITGLFQLELDADCVVGGDNLVCPMHPNITLHTFIKGWWDAFGGTFEKNAVINAFCGLCKRPWNIDTWSYRG